MTLRPRGPAEAEEPFADTVGRVLSRGRGVAAQGGRQLATTWRTSLQFRVVVTTILLGLVVVGLVGAYLYKGIGDGLETYRIRASQNEAQSLTTAAQSFFDSAPTTTVDDLNGVTKTYVQKLASPGTDQSRYVLLTRGQDNTKVSVLGTIRVGLADERIVSDALRAAVSADPQRQQTQVVTMDDGQSGARIPAVIVGSQVQLPIVGAYDLYFVYPMRSEAATLQRIARSFLLGASILILLVGAVAFVVARQVVVPIRRASVTAERLSAGNLNERMPSRGRDELALLGKSFNAMADSLQSQIHQLEGLSRVQQRFVSDVSHELRTPLTTIRMAADLIHDSRQEFEPGLARSAELLQTELDRFEELLADLLEISRFDAGAAALDTDPTDLVVLVDKVVEATSPLAEHRGSRVEVRSHGTSVIADIDPRRVERILRNLVVNAIEHGEGGSVSVELGSNDSAVAVVVEDRGVGLRPGEASLVFNRFWRADPARARTTGGTGLGLAISLEDARLHNGWLQAWGEPGAGSRFRLTLPRHTGVPIADSPLSLSPSPMRRPG